jgi:hypothetical protein
MAKITSKAQLNVGTELTVNTTNSTFTLNAAGNLVAKDGVTLQALYSKFVELWTTASYNKFEFPMYAIDALSGQFQFGTDGQTFSGWKPADDATRQMLRDGGWDEYSAAGVLNRQYVGIVSLGDVNSGAQLYYQRASTDAPANFTFTDEANEGIQVYGDSTNGNFDKRTYFKAFVREYGKKYKDSVLADTGKSATGAYIVNMLLSNEDDLKITDNDVTVAADAPYTGIDVTYYGTNQNITIGSGSYPFTRIIDGNNATLAEIYTKIQYLLRQDTDIDAGAGSVTGKTADSLCYFVGDTLYTTQGVFIENLQANDLNNVVFLDQNSVQRTYPYAAAGTINSNGVLTSGGTGYFRMYFTDLPGVLDYGLDGAITVNDKDGNPISGTITGSTMSFTFDYDGNVQGGRTAGTDANVTVVAGNPGHAKPVVTTGTITRSKGISVSLVAEQDRAYI